jgi:hypothetical protein
MLISRYTRAASNHASIAQNNTITILPFSPSVPYQRNSSIPFRGDEISDSKPLHSKSNQAQPPSFAPVHPHDQKNRVAGTVPRPAQSCRKLALITSVSNNRTPDSETKSSSSHEWVHQTLTRRRLRAIASLGSENVMRKFGLGRRESKAAYIIRNPSLSCWEQKVCAYLLKRNAERDGNGELLWIRADGAV